MYIGNDDNQSCQKTKHQNETFLKCNTELTDLISMLMEELKMPKYQHSQKQRIEDKKQQRK